MEPNNHDGEIQSSVSPAGNVANILSSEELAEMMDAEYRQLKANVNHAHETLMNAQRDYQQFITAVRKGKDFWHEAFGIYETGWKDVRWLGDTPVTIEKGSDTHVTEGSIAEYAFKLEQGKNGLGISGFDPALFLQLYRERLDEIQQAEHEDYE